MLGHLLTGLKLELRGLEKPVASVREALAARLTAARQLSQATVDAVRKVALELRPVVLDQLGLTTALDCAAREPDRAAAVFRIFEEALTNIARRAGATQVRVRLASEDGRLVLTVSDNGRGLPAVGTRKAGSLGVIGMRERALMVGGELRLHGPPGEGTTVTVSLPPPVVLFFSIFTHDYVKASCLARGARCFFDKGTEFDRVRETIVALVPLATPLQVPALEANARPQTEPPLLMPVQSAGNPTRVATTAQPTRTS